MKTLKNLSVFFFAMICGVAAFAQSPIAGTYEIKGQDPEGNAFAIKVTMANDFKHFVDFGADGTNEVEGQHTISGNEVTIWDIAGERACPADAKGVYTFSLEGKTLTMNKVSDDCQGRGSSDTMVMIKID